MSGTNIKLYKNDKLILDCTLCTNPEGRIGWWDAVEGKFHDETEIFLERAYRGPIGTQHIDTGVKPENVRMTNADYIRSMTDEELAKRNVQDSLEYTVDYDWDERPIGEYTPCFKTSDGAIFWSYEDAVDYELHWLKQPYKEEA